MTPSLLRCMDRWCSPPILAQALLIEPGKVIHSGDTGPKNLPAASPLPKVVATPDANTKQWIQVESPSELRFTAAGESAKYQLMPMNQIGEQRYSVYWQMQSPGKLS